MKGKTVVLGVVGCISICLLGALLPAQEQDPLAEASKLYQREQYAAAIDLLTQYIEALWQQGNQEEKVADAYYLMAKIYFETRQDELVEQTLIDLFDLFPNFTKKESNTAFAAFFEKVKKDPLAKARKYFAIEEYNEAISLLDDFIEKNRVLDNRKREVAEAYYLLAKVYYLKQDDALMNDSLTKLFAMYPDFSKAESDEGFKETLERFRSNPLAQAQEFYFQRDYTHAVPMLKEFIEKNRSKEDQKENVADAYYLLAKIFYLQRNDDQMKAILVKLYTVFPDFAKEETNEGFKAEAEKVRSEVVKDSR